MKAHADLHRAVDACYRGKPFDIDRERALVPIRPL
jgi:hypothetical protein